MHQLYRLPRSPAHTFAASSILASSPPCTVMNFFSALTKFCSYLNRLVTLTDRYTDLLIGTHSNPLILPKFTVQHLLVPQVLHHLLAKPGQHPSPKPYSENQNIGLGCLRLSRGPPFCFLGYKSFEGKSRPWAVGIKLISIWVRAPQIVSVDIG